MGMEELMGLAMLGLGCWLLVSLLGSNRAGSGGGGFDPDGGSEVNGLGDFLGFGLDDQDALGQGSG